MPGLEIAHRDTCSFYRRDTQVTLSHGSGDKATHNLIEGDFGPAFANPLLDCMDDSAIFTVGEQILDNRLLL